MKRLFISLGVLLLCFVLGYHIVTLWRGFYFYATRPSKEALLQALRLSPSNPDPYYRLGLFYLWDLQGRDPAKSLEYLGQAIRRNPLEQEYWLNWAKALQRTGETEAFEKALDKAILTFPTGYRGRWTAGNLLLQQQALEPALAHFSYILAHYPNQSSQVYDVWHQVTQDSDFLLSRLVPKDPAAFQRYLAYLYEGGDPEAVQKAWAMKASLHLPSDRKEALRYIEFLISKRELNAAFDAWKARLREEGLPLAKDGNLVTNGGFEEGEILGGGFDWRIRAVNGEETSFDRSVSLGGNQSLRIRFDGKENVDFQHVDQSVAWRPDTDYTLTVHLRTKGITTKSGVKIEVLGIGANFYKGTESYTGDHDWEEIPLSFRTPSRSQGGLIRIRREKTDKFDRFISGTAWIDDISLKQKQ
jgi:tetratricopeptide (TPR) repeat protein